MNEGDFLRLVRRVYSDRGGDDGVPYDDLIDEAVREFGVEETTVEQAIDYLLKRGEVYEPADDRLKPTDAEL